MQLATARARRAGRGGPPSSRPAASGASSSPRSFERMSSHSSSGSASAGACSAGPASGSGAARPDGVCAGSSGQSTSLMGSKNLSRSSNKSSDRLSRPSLSSATSDLQQLFFLVGRGVVHLGHELIREPLELLLGPPQLIFRDRVRVLKPL